MARSRITPQAPTFGQPLTLAFFSADAAAGHVIAQARNDVALIVRNASGAPLTVTIPAVNTNRAADDIYPKQTTPDIVLTIADGAEGIVAAIPDSHLINGDFNIDLSDDSGVTIAAFKFPQ